MSICKDCVSGWLRPGKPRGEVVRLHGQDVYVVRPQAGTSPKGIIVYITDGFGYTFNNNRLLADDYAEHGYLVYLPEFMNGWSCPTWALDLNPLLMKTDGGLLNWLLKPYYLACLIYCILPLAIVNGISRSHPRILEFHKSLRSSPSAEERNLPIFSAGFCWGGKHTVLLTHPSAKTSDGRPVIDAAFTAHPTAVKVPEDIEAVSVPLSVAVGSKDFLFPVEKAEQAKEILEKKDSGELVIYEGGQHGFAVRDEPYYGKADQESVKEDVRRQENLAKKAEEQAIAWFDKYLAVAGTY